jgi:hypothetical protein
MAQKLSKVAEANEKLAASRRVLFAAGCKSMEVIEDKAGVVAERFIRPGDGKSIILFGTTLWYDAYAPINNENNIEQYLTSLGEFARAGEKRE